MSKQRCEQCGAEMTAKVLKTKSPRHTRKLTRYTCTGCGHEIAVAGAEDNGEEAERILKERTDKEKYLKPTQDESFKETYKAYRGDIGRPLD
jgi:DNA-directed RNA polymerase subunit RPC12/RpoP